MKDIGLFYGVESDETAEVARRIMMSFRDIGIEAVAVEVAGTEDLKTYDYIIAGVATWPGGNIPEYWNNLLEELGKTDMKGKQVAIFGLGDQANYPDQFVDSIGKLADAFRNAGATLVGFTSTEGYQFTHSKAVENNQFKGLALDMDNQPGLTTKRIKEWVTQLKQEFFID